MHTYIFFSFFGVLFVMVLFCLFLSLSLSLSLSLIICTWHPSANSLRLRTLFILGHLLLILIHFIFGFVIRRPKRTSWRTSPNVVFIWRAAWFYQIFPILFYAPSFTVEDGNPYVRYPWVVPPWSFRSFTSTCTVLIPLYLSLLCAFKVHVL